MSSAYKEAQKALHSLMTGVLKQRYPEYITVMERMDSKRIHYHLLVVMAEDIRTGFDFAAVKRGDYRSAGDYLRREWKFWRETAPEVRIWPHGVAADQKDGGRRCQVCRQIRRQAYRPTVAGR